MGKDLYSILGVSKSATKAEIKSAYHKLARKYHPDVNKDNPSAAEKFKEISAAYDILGDDEKRKKYDNNEIDGDGKPTAPVSAVRTAAAIRSGRAVFIRLPADKTPTSTSLPFSATTFFRLSAAAGVVIRDSAAAPNGRAKARILPTPCGSIF